MLDDGSELDTELASARVEAVTTVVKVVAVLVSRTVDTTV